MGLDQNGSDQACVYWMCWHGCLEPRLPLSELPGLPACLMHAMRRCLMLLECCSHCGQTRGSGRGDREERTSSRILSGLAKMRTRELERLPHGAVSPTVATVLWMPCPPLQGLKEDAEYVVFNGAEGALTERQPLIVDQVSG